MSIDTVADSLVQSFNGTTNEKWYGPIKGFVFEGSQDDAIDLSKDDNINFVEEIVPLYPTSVQVGADYSLDRIDQRLFNASHPLDGTYTYNSDGTGTHIYIIDTGMRVTHNDFGGRAVTDYDGFTRNGHGNPDNDPYYGVDCYPNIPDGHGTQVAAVAGGATYGVAKNAAIHNIKITGFITNGCPNQTQWKGEISAINWIIANRQNPAVVNMSYTAGATGTQFGQMLNAAVNAMIDSGITVVVAAGNSNADACLSSPSSVPNAITVGYSTFNSIDYTDSRHPNSNYGSCVDLFAPAVQVKTASKLSDSAISYSGGSSLAAPFTAGVAALYLQGNPNSTPAQVTNAIINAATPNILLNTTQNPLGAGSPNLLLYSFTYTPTATYVNVSGLVTANNNSPLSMALVTLTASGGQTYSAYTSPFGYYTIPNVPVGHTYAVEASKKGYTFNPQVKTVNSEVFDLNFIAQ